MGTADYWQQRFEQLEELLLNLGDVQYVDIEKQFNLAMQSIEKDITLWYKRLAVNNNISYVDAKKFLTSKELEEFHWTVEDYIKKGKENAVAQQWLKQLENASTMVHISRLDALKLQLQQELEILYGNQVDDIDKTMQDIYSRGFYNTAFEIDKGIGVGRQLNRLDSDKVKIFIAKPWAADGKNFSDRLWQDKDKLINTLHTEITQATIRGDPLDKAVNNLARKMNSAKSAAGRIVMTETAFFASAAQKDAFKNLGVGKYQFVATLDRRTSAICRSMDNKVFKLSDYQPGVTAPPLHCWCRSCIVPYFEDDTKSMRAARTDNDKTYNVPADMSYDKWEKEFIKEDKANPTESVANVSTSGYNKGIEATYKKALAFGKRTGNEGLYWIDNNGDSAYPDLTGTQNAVSFTPNLIKFLRDAASGSLTCVHNHPGSSSFSPEDLNVMCAFNSIDCMRVIAHDGTRYFAEVGNGQRVSLPTIKKLYDKIMYDLIGEFRKRINSGELDNFQAWKEHSHKIIEKVAEKYGWTYRRELNEE
ncbi:minor capsid protein [Pectinatus frisingensis]|uniref:minor capsid protein n=1 Tax=Pectinatus frisingensis TaxID=865 RepID=UPI0018C565ED|nr:minor capsid protein [Pectinatus frisingensis]